MILIRELNEDTKVIIEESANAPKKYFIEGIFMQAEIKNRNGRMYPKPVMEKAVNEFQTIIDANRAIGEMKHPSSPQVDPERASHKIQKLYWEGSNVMGKAKVMTEMPMGKIAKGLIDEGIQLGVSSRGLGTLKTVNGLNEVQDDFFIATVDIVLDPSGPECFVNAIHESAEWIFESGIWKQKQIEEIQRTIKKTTRSKLTEMQLNIFESIFKNVR